MSEERSTSEAIREKLLSAAMELKEFQDRMAGYTKQLPPVSDDELEAEETLEGELLGLLECLIDDDLKPAVEKLQSAARLRPAAAPSPPREPRKARTAKRPKPGKKART